MKEPVKNKTTQSGNKFVPDLPIPCSIEMPPNQIMYLQFISSNFPFKTKRSEARK